MTAVLPDEIESVGATFNEQWRRRKSAAFDLLNNSSARRTVPMDLWGRNVNVYANANLSIYSAQKCNAACPFCVEELRPVSRGRNLADQRSVELDDGRYLKNLQEVLRELRPLRPTLSITGGEPSKDPLLPRILNVVCRVAAPRRTLTTNASGLMDLRDGRRVIDSICGSGLTHLNISVAHPDSKRNARLMRLNEGLQPEDLARVAKLARSAGIRVRLSCVLLRQSVAVLQDMLAYLHFAQSIGVDNVIFRQLMKSDPQTHVVNSVVQYSDAQRVVLEPLLDQLSRDRRFDFRRQVMGYYYYVEVWRYQNMDVVFEEADLGQLEKVKRRDPATIHELVFHPNAMLASTWQPWDGVLGPRELSGVGDFQRPNAQITQGG